MFFKVQGFHYISNIFKGRILNCPVCGLDLNMDPTEYEAQAAAIGRELLSRQGTQNFPLSPSARRGEGACVAGALCGNVSGGCLFEERICRAVTLSLLPANYISALSAQSRELRVYLSRCGAFIRDQIPKCVRRLYPTVSALTSTGRTSRIRNSIIRHEFIFLDGHFPPTALRVHGSPSFVYTRQSYYGM
jgi:hypothetical protein